MKYEKDLTARRMFALRVLAGNLDAALFKRDEQSLIKWVAVNTIPNQRTVIVDDLTKTLAQFTKLATNARQEYAVAHHIGLSHHSSIISRWIIQPHVSWQTDMHDREYQLVVHRKHYLMYRWYMSSIVRLDINVTSMVSAVHGDPVEYPIKNGKSVYEK